MLSIQSYNIRNRYCIVNIPKISWNERAERVELRELFDKIEKTQTEIPPV